MLQTNEVIEEGENVIEETLESRVRKWFKFGHKYIPQQDRLEMLHERIPPARKLAEIKHADMMEDGQRLLICPGGIGGLGNPHFVSPTIPGPKIAGKGEQGYTKIIKLELKTLADVGMVGLPNAGKSTLLESVSNAHPRIAPYPFTTINPYVGVVEFSDCWRLTLADIPGIIKGAHQNRGLGHNFLRHIERNKVLIYVIDLASPEPWNDLQILIDELDHYKPGLTARPSIICANKADITSPAKENLEILKLKTNWPIVPVSAKDRQNIKMLTSLMRQMVEGVRSE